MQLFSMPLLPGGSTCYMCQCLGPAAVKSSLDAASSLMLGPQAQKTVLQCRKSICTFQHTVQPIGQAHMTCCWWLMCIVSRGWTDDSALCRKLEHLWSSYRCFPGSERGFWHVAQTTASHTIMSCVNFQLTGTFSATWNHGITAQALVVLTRHCLIAT